MILCAILASGIPASVTAQGPINAQASWEVVHDAPWAAHEHGFAIALSPSGTVVYTGSLVFVGNLTVNGFPMYALKVVARDASTGAVMWTAQHGHPLGSPSNGNYFHRSQEVLLSVDPATGKLAAAVSLADDYPWHNAVFLLSPLGQLLWSTWDYSAIAVDELTFHENLLIAYFARARGLDDNSVPWHNFYAFDIANGARIAAACSYASPDALCREAGKGFSIGQDRAIIGTLSGSGESRLIAYDLEVGSRTWLSALPRKSNESLRIAGVEVVGGLAVVAAAQVTGSRTSLALFGVDVGDGHMVWARPHYAWDTPPRATAASGSNVFVLAGEWVYSISASTGQMNWRSRFLVPEIVRSEWESFRGLIASSDGSQLVVYGDAPIGQSKHWVAAGFDGSDGTLLWTENRTSWRYDMWHDDSLRSVPLAIAPSSSSYFVISPGEVGGATDYVLEARVFAALPSARPHVEVSVTKEFVNLGQSVTYSVVEESTPPGVAFLSVWEWDEVVVGSAGPLTFTYSTPGLGCVTRRVTLATGVSTGSHACAQISDRLLLNVSTSLHSTFHTPRLDVGVTFESGGPAAGVLVTFTDTFRPDDPAIRDLQEELGCERTQSTYNTGANGRANFQISFTSRCMGPFFNYAEFAGNHTITLSGRDEYGNIGSWRGVIRTEDSLTSYASPS